MTTVEAARIILFARELGTVSLDEAAHAAYVLYLDGDADDAAVALDWLARHRRVAYDRIIADVLDGERWDGMG